jgi:hypothetical protein
MPNSRIARCRGRRAPVWLHAAYTEAPSTNLSAYREAQHALNSAEDIAFPGKENRCLPPNELMRPLSRGEEKVFPGAQTAFSGSRPLWVRKLLLSTPRRVR